MGEISEFSNKGPMHVGSGWENSLIWGSRKSGRKMEGCFISIVFDLAAAPGRFGKKITSDCRRSSASSLE